jgi:Holliday junction resolvase RusA-like endonuclease
MRIVITIPGEPKAKGRPRFYRAGKFVRAVTPEMTVKYEQHVKNCAMLQAQGQMLHGPLHARISFFFDLPKSKWKKREPVKRQWHTGKPDWDNLGKAVCDSLNGICYKDDAEICSVRVVKITEEQGGAPARCELIIEELSALELCATRQWLDQMLSTT